MTEDTDNLVLRMKTPGNAVCSYGTGGDRFPEGLR